MSRRKIALLLQSLSEYHRQVLRGVANYAHEHEGWEFYIKPCNIDVAPFIPSGWHGDGIICRLTSPSIVEIVEKTKVPAVNVSWLGEHTKILPKVIPDEAECGRLAAEHFIEFGIGHLAYISPLGRLGYSDVLGQTFKELALEANRWGGCFRQEDEPSSEGLCKSSSRLKQWLAELPRPTGLLVWDGIIGRDVMNVCNSLEINVPDDIAILCLEHETLMSSLATVPMSNIDHAPLRVGFNAAELLDQMMSGIPAPESPILIPPHGVIQRQSTDTFATEDPLITEGIRYIRENCHLPIQVIDVQKALGLTRRVLENRFSKVLQHTPADVIRRARLERAKRLLIETDLTIAVIAFQTGFNLPEALTRAFRRELGVTPGEFRNRR